MTPRIDWDCGDIIIGDERRHIVPKQLAILKKLVERSGKPVSMGTLIQHLYGDDINGGPNDAANVTRVHIHRLRKRLPWTIRRRWGYGYSIEDYDQPALARAV